MNRIVKRCFYPWLLLSPVAVSAAQINLSDLEFVVAPAFNNVQTFSFQLALSGPLGSGVVNNPGLVSIDYQVRGGLPEGSPSGFPAFNLVRSIGGTEFYAQGSSLEFNIAAGADLSDGLQVSELLGSGVVFALNAREVDTGRYHPPLLELNADGTGRILNSNNQGDNTTNPATGELVDVNFGEEYITNLSFNPELLTIATVPVPAAGWLLLTALGLGFGVSRKSG